MHTLQHDKQTKIEVYYIYMPWQLITKHTQRNNYSPATQDAKYDLISDRGVALGFVLCMATCNVLADRAQGE